MAASSSSSSAGSSRTDELWRRVGEAAGPAADRPELAPLLDKVRAHAWRITDADVEGLDADALYEAVLPVAFAVADEKRRRAHEAIDAR
ncbi:MAG TPA: hypothetical protein VFW41_04220 [Gaiellaceae bacterium]|jgi:hypothetical protein|nr:hypothetical protein [Gaiellaceae bacterium]